MDALLSDLGVVNEKESNVHQKVQDIVEEAQAAAANAHPPGSGAPTTKSGNKRAMLETIMNDANAASDPSLLISSKSHTQRKGYQKEERVKFISVLDDIPNPHDRETKFQPGKKGFYNPSTSLNLFSSSQNGRCEYRSSTNVDASAIHDIMRDAKKERTMTIHRNDSKRETHEQYVHHNKDDSTDKELLFSVDDDQGFPHRDVDQDPEADITAVDPLSDDLTCPFCRRSLQHLVPGSTPRTAVGAKDSFASLVEQHVDRCSRRGSRNITNYNYDEQDFDDRARRRSVSATRSASSNKRHRNGTSISSRISPHSEEADSPEEKEFAVEDQEEEEDWDMNSTTEERPSRTRNENLTRNRIVRRNVNCNSNTSQSHDNSNSSGKSRVRTTHATRSRSTPLDEGTNASKNVGIARNTSAQSLHSSSDGAEDLGGNEWAGFVSSIVDDWEDDAYITRIEQLQKKQKRLQYRRAKLKSKKMKRNNQNNLGVSTSPEEIVPDDVEDENSEFIRTDYGVEVLRRTWASLHEYQHAGCRWLHKLYDEGVGGILGDEMGLGKTAQMCTHLGSLALLHDENRQPAAVASVSAGRCMSSIFIVVCPATVLHHWLQEFHHWAPFMRAVVLHGISATAAELLRVGNTGIPKVLRRLQRKPETKGLVVITTYEGLRKYRQALVSVEWTAVCLDEGQKIRNPATEITATCKMLPAFHRVILSGTPIQNSLRELWSLFDFIYPGRLGALPVFEQEFANPIRAGGYANANALQYEIAIRCASTLQKIVKPYLLRRKKDDLIAVTKLPPKTEQVLFCQISPRQREIYLNIIESSEVKAVMQRKIMAFRAINTLRKLCNHPALVFQQGKILWQQDPTQAPRVSAISGQEEAEDDDDVDAALLSKVGSGGLVWADSGKLLVLSKLLPLWYSEGHKVLIFSQTRSMLSVIESMVRELGFLYLRLDGSTPVGKRAGIVNQYNSNPNIFVMLLTTRTGGVGISLTAANRVVLFDPDWNPMTDMQSRERAWRLGQKREVTVYRLITRGTIEEKIYQRQIFKLLLSNRILENAKQKAIFAESHIKELFELNDSFSNAGQDRHGYGVSNEALPVGGEVDLLQEQKQQQQQQQKQQQQQQQQQFQQMRQQETDQEEGEQWLQNRNHDNGSNNIALQNSTDHYLQATNGLVEVEDYVEADPLPASVVDELDENEEPGADGSNSRDRRLLQALFAGDAITSVYDHHYFDPSTTRSDINREDRLRRATERVAIQQEASNAVTKALSGLQSSARVYQGPMPRVEEVSSAYECSGENSLNTAGRSSYETQGKERAASPLFPTAQTSSSRSSRFGNSRATLAGTPSAALLAGLRGTASSTVDDGSNSMSGVVSATGNESMNRRISFGVSESGSRVLGNVLLDGSDSRTKLSIKQDIALRLHALFSTADRPLTTAFVLSRFRDLGDQYAPLFRELLRGAATHRNGTWSKK